MDSCNSDSVAPQPGQSRRPSVTASLIRRVLGVNRPLNRTAGLWKGACYLLARHGAGSHGPRHQAARNAWPWALPA